MLQEADGAASLRTAGAPRARSSGTWTLRPPRAAR